MPIAAPIATPRPRCAARDRGIAIFEPVSPVATGGIPLGGSKLESIDGSAAGAGITGLLMGVNDRGPLPSLGLLNACERALDGAPERGSGIDGRLRSRAAD